MAELNVKNVPDEVLQKAKRIAKEQDRPVSQVVRELLREWVKKNDK